jgi:hypothetical protein
LTWLTILYSSGEPEAGGSVQEQESLPDPVLFHATTMESQQANCG